MQTYSSLNLSFYCSFRYVCTHTHLSIYILSIYNTYILSEFHIRTKTKITYLCIYLLFVSIYCELYECMQAYSSFYPCTIYLSPTYENSFICLLRFVSIYCGLYECMHAYSSFYPYTIYLSPTYENIFIHLRLFRLRPYTYTHTYSSMNLCINYLLINLNTRKCVRVCAHITHAHASCIEALFGKNAAISCFGR